MTAGKFYLGKETPGMKDPFLYNCEDLTTHAIVFGMTGSGKTGLCIDILEEAIEEDIPVIVIDPKGDVSNLALLFPEFNPDEFSKWVSPAEAKRKGRSVREYGEDTSNMWREGLADWGIDGERIRRIRDKMDLRIFTPGSSYGLGISILEGFTRPDSGFSEDEEAKIQKIKSTVSALLSLMNMDSNPLNSKPHILISTIVEHFWRNEKDLTIEELILNIQKPPIKKLGVFEINQIMDSNERIELAFRINNIIASPSFRFWKTGEPLSAEKLYKKRGKKVPVNIFYTAHLPENERMFFSSLLLNEIVFWIRRQPGSTDLKYLFYMDEIYGYLPPYPNNPPSKNPMMLLMKQARAFGLGVVLVTQNPKDIDYKALTNTGTWFIGKLQAEGDIERVMEGLEGLIADHGEPVKSKELKNLITNLKKREFLVKNVHRKGVSTFYARWAMSFLCGPLTGEQIKVLTEDRGTNSAPPEPSLPGTPVSNGKPTGKDELFRTPPIPRIPIEYLYERSDEISGKRYSPFIYLIGEIIFDENNLGLFIRKKMSVTAPLKAVTEWDDVKISDSVKEYSTEYSGGSAGFDPITFDLNMSMMKKIRSSLRDHIYANMVITLYRNRELNILSGEGESEETFRLTCRSVVEKMIDKEIDKKKDIYEKRINRIADKLEREKQNLGRLEDEHQSRKTEEIVSLGETVLGFILGSRSRRGLSAAARKRRMTSSAKDRMQMGKIRISQLEEELLMLREDLENEVAETEDKFYRKADKIEPFEVRLEKEDIIISSQSILWRLL